MIKVIKWETSKGNKATVEIKFVTEETIDSDGDKTTVPCCALYVTTHLDGKILGYNEPRPLANVPGFTGVISGKLAVPADKMEEIKAAIAEIMATPEMLAANERDMKSIDADIEYAAHCEKMKKAMGN